MLDRIFALLYAGPAPHPLGLQTTAPLARLHPLDITVIAIYFAMVLWIGFYLKGMSSTGEEFFMAGREMNPPALAGLDFDSM